ncbi:MAG TPA: DUF1192 domain-containing protein [Xanthobacteraceae bacterium]|jgi:uncharacterized small protein (DUF1192 family)
MPSIEDDAPPKKKLVHEIGQDLALLSVEELQDRIAALHAEVARLETSLQAKRASRDAAQSFFKT